MLKPFERSKTITGDIIDKNSSVAKIYRVINFIYNLNLIILYQKNIKRYILWQQKYVTDFKYKAIYLNLYLKVWRELGEVCPVDRLLSSL